MITLRNKFSKLSKSYSGQVFMNDQKLITHYKSVKSWELDANKGKFRLEVVFAPSLSKMVYFATKKEMKAYLEGKVNSII